MSTLRLRGKDSPTDNSRQEHVGDQHLMQRLQAPELDLHVAGGGEAVGAKAPAVWGRLDLGAVGLSALLRILYDTALLEQS